MGGRQVWKTEKGTGGCDIGEATPIRGEGHANLATAGGEAGCIKGEGEGSLGATRDGDQGDDGAQGHLVLGS